MGQRHPTLRIAALSAMAPAYLLADASPGSESAGGSVGEELATSSFLRRGGAGLRPPPLSARGRGRPAPAPLKFSGAPAFREGEAALLDVTVLEDRVLKRLRVRFLEKVPLPLVQDWLLLVYAEDMAMPAVGVRLSDLMGQSGERPLNLFVPSGSRLRIVLRDDTGPREGEGPGIEVIIE